MMEAQGMKVDSEKMQAMKGMLDSIDPDDMKDLVGMAASMQSEVGEAPTQAEQLKKMQEAMAKNPEMGEKMRKTLGKQLQNTKLIGSVKEQVSLSQRCYIPHSTHTSCFIESIRQRCQNTTLALTCMLIVSRLGYHDTRQVSSETVKQGAQQMGHDLGDKTATFVAVVIRAFLSLWMGLIAVWQMTKVRACSRPFVPNHRACACMSFVSHLSPHSPPVVSLYSCCCCCATFVDEMVPACLYDCAGSFHS